MKNADVLNYGCFLHYSFFLLHSSFRLAVFQQPVSAPNVLRFSRDGS